MIIAHPARNLMITRRFSKSKAEETGKLIRDTKTKDIRNNASDHRRPHMDKEWHWIILLRRNNSQEQICELYFLTLALQLKENVMKISINKAESIEEQTLCLCAKCFSLSNFYI